MAKERVIAAMSGGVDSAVAAGLLVESRLRRRRRDHENVCANTSSPRQELLRQQRLRRCPPQRGHARSSALRAGFPGNFSANVVERFVDDYVAGRTPNPCVSCNNFVKLGTLAQYADRLGARFVATGHYARVERRDDGPHLFRSRHEKDQAYALAQSAPEQLESAAAATELNSIKRPLVLTRCRLGLPVHDKTESQDICFVEGGDYREIVGRLRPEVKATGTVVTASGAVVGEHDGVVNYTIGQRARPAGEQRRSPIRDAHSRCDQHDRHRSRRRTAFGRARLADEVNLIRPERFGSDDVPVRAMIRYRATPTAAVATIFADGRLRLRFDEPQRAVSPGQLVALLDPTSDEVLGAATIAQSL